MSAQSDRRVGDGMLVLAAGALACATVVTPPGPTSSVRTLVLAVLAAALVVTAVVQRSAPVFRASVVVSIVFVIFTGGAWLGVGPVVTAIAVSTLPLLVLVLVQQHEAWRPALPWLRVGRLDPLVWTLAAATVLGAVAALTLFAVLVRPEVSDYLMALRSMPPWLAVIGVVGFAVVNPIWEEVLYRGVLQGELSSTIGSWPAVVVQALLFGLSHLYGFPSGWMGVAMAATWGFGLGVIRRRTGGLVLPYLLHVTANLTIGALAVVLLR